MRKVAFRKSGRLLSVETYLLLADGYELIALNEEEWEEYQNDPFFELRHDFNVCFDDEDTLI